MDARHPPLRHVRQSIASATSRVEYRQRLCRCTLQRCSLCFSSSVFFFLWIPVFCVCAACAWVRATRLFPAFGFCANYCHERVWMLISVCTYVCVSLCKHISKTRFSKILMLIACGRGSAVLRRRRDTLPLLTSGVVNNVIFVIIMPNSDSDFVGRWGRTLDVAHQRQHRRGSLMSATVLLLAVVGSVHCLARNCHCGCGCCCLHLP